MKTIKHTTTVQYREGFIPKGCRKPRYQLAEHQVTFKVKQVEKEDTELAFIVYEFECDPREIRIYKNKFYKQEFIPYKEDGVFHLYERWDYLNDIGKYNTPEDVEQFQKQLDNTLIVGDEVYKRCYQPYYSVHTFGVGSSWCFSVEIPTIPYTDYELRGIAPDDIEQLESKCNELNISFSRNYGPKTLEKALEYNRIEIIKPDALKMKFQNTENVHAVWNEKQVGKILKADVTRFMEREKRKLAKNFKYLSNCDFASLSSLVIDGVMREIESRKC